jgi:hypothetical protein
MEPRDLDALCDTLWRDATLRHPPAADAPWDSALPLDLLMERVITMWLTVQLSTEPPPPPPPPPPSVVEEMERMFLRAETLRTPEPAARSDSMEAGSSGSEDEAFDTDPAADAMELSLEAEEALRARWAATAAKEKRRRDTQGERIEYAAPTAAAVDWSIVFDGKGREVLLPCSEPMRCRPEALNRAHRCRSRRRSFCTGRSGRSRASRSRCAG